MPSSIPTQPPLNLKPGFSLQLHRGETLTIAVVGIIVGVMALIWQDATLVLIGVLFGAYLIVAGIVRISAAMVSRHVRGGQRFLIGLLGLLILVAGVMCIADPTQSIVLLAFVIGVGWIANGVIDLIGAAARTIYPRWFGVIGGLFSLLAGLVALTLPVLTLQAFVVVGAILLIAISIMSLLTLPRRAPTTAW
ncbi:HdeD family acid-resistance protein [Rathayibacter soli]|uniref:HdeD family acid-resistance protein n=1 Tax=Rathayibacter soli TaxID=3144168 RepID=UPI0027E5499D|nr:DUF308 domain-containing protein [Glaciibacter superstes]